jgi:arginyl-tRNA synthetase
MPFLDLKKQLARELADYFKIPEVTPEVLEQDFSLPPNASLGHLALPCFKFSKHLKRASDQIARELQANFAQTDLSVVATGPYANFKWKLSTLYETVCRRVFGEELKYGSDTSGKSKSVVLEYCSPNIAKRLAFQHIRSTLIGNTLANVHDFLGYRTERINFVGDWGSQFARLLAAFEKWGDKQRLSQGDAQLSMDHLLEVYVRFHKEAENHPELMELASRSLQRLEEQENGAVNLWKQVRKISLTSMERTLGRLNIRFDHVEGESHYIPEMAATLEAVKTKAGARLSEGAWIVEIDGINTPALIQKKDGTTLYLTRDIAAAIDREERFKFDRMIYVVSEQQRLHFQLLFGVLSKMGYPWSQRCEHVSFGTVLFGKEKMSTREGRVVLLDDILNEAKALALKECIEKNPDLANKESVAEMVGIGAVIFGNLSTHRQRDFEFDWAQVIALDGETGPYVQYSYVRCHSLLEKAAEKGIQTEATQAPPGYEFAAEEEMLIIQLAKFRGVLHDTARESEPFHLTHYLIDLAKAFNRFYYKLPVLQCTDSQAMKLRLNLVQATRQALTNGLTLLGIRAPKEM